LTLVIAHRGSSKDETENSLAAFRRAVRDGADGVELDVHATSDGDLVVVHDAILDGQAIASMPFREVRRHRLPNGDLLPTLSEALETIGARTLTFIEVKAMEAAHEQRLLSIIETAPAPENCHVHSFDHRIIARLGKHRSRAQLGVLSCSYLVQPASQIDQAGAGVLWQEESMIDRELVDVVHRADGKIYAWTVDSPSRMTALASIGVDGICTNRPALAKSVLK
jgi:glycerophosphoryl diester phosphodiesterase